jgi:hypothetical protein
MKRYAMCYEPRDARPDRMVIAWMPEQPRLRVVVPFCCFAQRWWFWYLIDRPRACSWEISFDIDVSHGPF